MHSSAGMGGGARRRPRVGRIVLVALLIAVISEPLIMYHALSREKEKRRAAAEMSIVETPAARRSTLP